jgi:serine/threonine-protein phosphatase 2A regulatory subunit B
MSKDEKENIQQQSNQQQILSESIETPTAKLNIQSQQIKILEWRYNQFLGERLTESEMKDDENQSYIISEMKMNESGEYLVVGDHGGRIIIFQRGESKKNKILPRLTYFYEYSAFDRDFDVHKSSEYSEMVRGLAILPSQYLDKVDILSCGYRTIKLHRLYNSKIKMFSVDDLEYDRDQSQNLNGQKFYDNSSNLIVPKLRSVKRDLNSKLKKTIKIENSTEINSLSYNNIFKNQFISSDESKILLWDINHTDQAFNIIDIESDTSDFTCENYNEKITKSIIHPRNPHLISYSTNYGQIKICDLRSSSDLIKTSSKFLDEFRNITNSSFNLTKTIFSSQIMSVHDINFSLSNENLFVSRHSLSINIWDQRKPQEPCIKFLVFEPILSKLSQLYTKNYLANDKFSISTDPSGKYILTGGYNNMFHVFDVEQKLNQQIQIDCENEKIMNTNIIRKINLKGSCYYKKEDPKFDNIDFNKKILKHTFSPKENFINLSVLNCIYCYNGNYIKKETNVNK